MATKNPRDDDRTAIKSPDGDRVRVNLSAENPNREHPAVERGEPIADHPDADDGAYIEGEVVARYSDTRYLVETDGGDELVVARRDGHDAEVYELRGDASLGRPVYQVEVADRGEGVETDGGRVRTNPRAYTRVHPTPRGQVFRAREADIERLDMDRDADPVYCSPDALPTAETSAPSPETPDAPLTKPTAASAKNVHPRLRRWLNRNGGTSTRATVEPGTNVAYKVSFHGGVPYLGRHDLERLNDVPGVDGWSVVGPADIDGTGLKLHLYDE